LVSRWQEPGKGARHLLSLMRRSRLKSVLTRMLDETEFLSDYGIRSLSRYHLEHPYEYHTEEDSFEVRYVAGEAESDMFGGNSNWRGPVWFPVNYLIIESLQKFHAYYGDSFTVEYPTGSGQLAWNPVANARGYLATAVGAGENDTMVMWSSSEVQASAFALPDFLSDADLQRLVASKALMAPSTTKCTIPQEVLKIAPQAMVQLAAYGGETNISYPPRPADPKAPWNIDWALKVRYKSQTGALLGMEMPGMAADDERGAPGAPTQTGQQPTAPFGVPGLGGAILKGLGGRLPGL
ncbi:MAG: hypothetical protein EON94_14150, partial [Caulobacteraceae bacterium]